MPPLVEMVERDGEHGLAYNFHPGQRRAWESTKRVVAVIAGGRSGKTSFAPCWLHREMLRQGPGDYLVAGPSYPIIDKAAGPEVEAFFGSLLHAGTLTRSPFQFAFSRQGCLDLWGVAPDRQPRILFCHADQPESLEALGAMAAWIDEGGQGRFRLESFEAVRQRLAVDEGRLLITSKPYNMGWLKTHVYDPWERSGRDHPEIDVVSFDSTWNPAFPVEEFERARRDLPAWKFDMQYRGVFSRPAGLIYDCFDTARHVVRRFPVPPDWPRYLGLDFGAVNTAAVFFAEDPASRKLYAYREYHAGNRSSREHAALLLAGEYRVPFAVGGAPRTEDGWREAFTLAGLYVHEPDVKLVEVGIDRVYSAFRRDEVYVFADLCGLLEELASYSRVLDPQGEPTQEIEEKSSYHHLDAVRYIIGWLRKTSGVAGGVAEIRSGGGVFNRAGIAPGPNPFGGGKGKMGKPNLKLPW